MSDENETTLATPGLDALVKAMSAPAPVVRVGILGQKSVRQSEGGAEDSKAGKEGELNNAEIGVFHEFGTEKMPMRSFLRVPIAEHLEKRMESSGALDKDVLKETIASKTLLPYMKKVAVLAEGIVTDAFDTGGFGKWAPSDMSQKANHQTLVETQQLRNSITSDVKEGSE